MQVGKYVPSPAGPDWHPMHIPIDACHVETDADKENCKTECCVLSADVTTDSQRGMSAQWPKYARHI